MNTNYFLRIFIVKHVFLIRRKIFLSKAFTKTITVILSFLERERERTVNVILQSFQSVILYSMIVACRSPSLTVTHRSWNGQERWTVRDGERSGTAVITVKNGERSGTLNGQERLGAFES